MHIQSCSATVILLLLHLISINSSQADSIHLGSTGPSGGIVFYIDSSGVHGLEAQLTDYNNGEKLPWKKAIEAGKSYGPGWHLPTLTELNLLYDKNDIVGINGDGASSTEEYWSSTENESGSFLWTTDAWIKSFYKTGGYVPGDLFYRSNQYGQEYSISKRASFRLRSVRAF